jgi:replication factor A1
MKVLSEYGTPDKVNETPISIDAYEEENGLAKSEPQQQPQDISGNNFYGQQKPNQPAPAATNNGYRPTESKHANIYPIAGLSPYAHKWTIKARVSAKTPIRSWHNQKGTGRLFSVTLLDESGDIRATAFDSSDRGNFDQLYEMFQEGGVYYISNPCKVSFANKQFSGGIKHDYELQFERDTKVEPAEDAGGIPSINYNFTDILGLEKVEVGTVIDTIGVLKEIGPTSEITSQRSGKPFTKRELTIADDTHHEVRLTIWGEQALNFNGDLESVLAFKGVKVSDFGGRSLSLTSGGSMKVNPDIQEAHKLKGWYDAQGRNEKFQTHAALNARVGTSGGNQFKTAIQIKDEQLGLSDAPDFFSFKGTVQFISRNSTMYYPACRVEGCNKKVVESDTNPGEWRCELHERTFDRPQYRFILRVCAVDHTGSIWLNLFDDGARILMGKSADEVQELKENSDEGSFNYEIDEMALWKTYNFRCRAKLDTYGDQQRQVTQYHTIDID